MRARQRALLAMASGLVAAVCAAPALAPAAAATPAAPRAQRIVTLAPHLAELACAVGACARLVAVSARSDYPPEVAGKPQVGDGFAINIEAVLLARPDLVLAWDGGTPVASIERLRQLGLRVVALKVTTLDGVADALRDVGAATGDEAAAQQAAEAYRARLAERRARHAGAAPIRAIYQVETGPAWTVGRESPISAAIAACGGSNPFAASIRLAGSVSAEAMLAASPEVVLYGGEENGAAMRAYWARLAQVPAVRFGNLEAVDADRLARATPRLIEALDEVCAALDRGRARRAAATR